MFHLNVLSPCLLFQSMEVLSCQTEAGLPSCHVVILIIVQNIIIKLPAVLKPTNANEKKFSDFREINWLYCWPQAFKTVEIFSVYNICLPSSDFFIFIILTVYDYFMNNFCHFFMVHSYSKNPPP